ncbi:MAG: DUF935 domain-containing protein [Propionibacteriaceae bacterium]|nr:DUF935 domain-containing protein [Propionibacteriaceae bacterium]
MQDEETPEEARQALTRRSGKDKDMAPRTPPTLAAAAGPRFPSAVVMPRPGPEIGYQTAGALWGGWPGWDDRGELPPELRWPVSVRTFAQARHETQVGAMLDAVTLPVMGTRWYIDPAGADDAVVALVANDLNLPVRDRDGDPPLRTRDRFSWPDYLRLALGELTYGHAFFEQVYRVGDDGMTHVHKLAWRPPETIAKIEVAPDGGLVAIEQHPAGGATVPRIPVGRLVAHVNRREGGRWYGQSLLVRAYPYYVLKQTLVRLMALTDQRNGMGMPVYEPAPVDVAAVDAGMVTAEKARQDLVDEIEAAKKLVQEVRAGDEAGVALTPGAKFTFAGVTGELPDIQSDIRYCDEQINASVLAGFLNLGQATGTGSYALGDTLQSFFFQSLQSIATGICDVTNSHVIEDLVDLNFGPAVRAPRLAFDEIGAKGIAEALSILANAGILLPEPNLEGFVRHLYGIPDKAPYTKPARKTQTTTKDDKDEEAADGTDDGTG